MAKNWGLGKYRYSRSRIQAIKKSHCKWELTKEQYYYLIKQRCIYCNKKLEQKGIGLDKKNPNILIYRLNNVVPCCKRCNWIKGTWFTYRQMIKIGKLIKKF